jgi:hypothetical protein
VRNVASEEERLRRIENSSPAFIREATRWWNRTADAAVKRFIITAAYYETLNAALGTLDEELRELDNDDE